VYRGSDRYLGLGGLLRELKIPGKARNELQKGFERLAKNDPAGSLSHFTKATQAFPGYFEAYYHMGVAEMKLGHNEEATKAFQMAIDLSGGQYAWAEFGIGYLLCQEGKPGEAEKPSAGDWKWRTPHLRAT
jgi:Tfp pilus assembly protein PilF